MDKIKLNKYEKSIEMDLIKGKYRPATPAEFSSIAQAIANRKKDALLSIRVNTNDLERLKQKAKKLGIAYQTFISEILHRFAA
ncbi:MAG TPA: hypothetical protein DDW49_10745 [Deltaproteobacteria bacterium]|nr:MAG: hypothetical protein A2048_07065 [Deltaproteobacteria bacterium GWA2_45_12]HBF13841.1 hypothetical protein [Deltaproteobacteria bacterium]